MKHRVIIWKSIEYQGMEYLTLDETANGVQIESVVIGVQSDGAFRLDYQIVCDSGYIVRDLRMRLAGGKTLHLKSDGQGRWTDGEGQPMPEFKGCIDIDISSTPFTNTLPIKRIQWKPGQSEIFNMVWFAVPEMTIHVDAQKYTCVEQTPMASVFRFEQVTTGFTALLSIDADGLVRDYPGLFSQI